MNDGIRPLIAGNWKMNGLKASMAEFDAMLAGAAAFAGKVDLLVCPPATLIAAFTEKAKGKGVAVGAQDCHPNASGAHTGDLSAEMFRDAGATAIIVGHSERRADHGESDALVRQRPRRSGGQGLSPSSASARPASSATPARPSRSAAPSSRAHCRTDRWLPISSWPMSRSGRSEP